MPRTRPQGLSFRPLPPRWEWLPSGHDFCRHRHADAYVSVIISGGFDEAGDHGRRRVGPGEVLFHGAFDAHAEGMMNHSRLFNLALPHGFVPEFPHGVLRDPDAVVRRAERDPAEALEMILLEIRPVDAALRDWPDLLAHAIVTDEAKSLHCWAERNDIHPAGLSRGFRQVFGASPARFRRERRARRAWQQIVRTAEPLSGIAHDLGFSDQAHMCREVRSLTGNSPASWRGLKKFNT